MAGAAGRNNDWWEKRFPSGGCTAGLAEERSKEERSFLFLGREQAAQKKRRPSQRNRHRAPLRVAPLLSPPHPHPIHIHTSAVCCGVIAPSIFSSSSYKRRLQLPREPVVASPRTARGFPTLKSSPLWFDPSLHSIDFDIQPPLVIQVTRFYQIPIQLSPLRRPQPPPAAANQRQLRLRPHSDQTSSGPESPHRNVPLAPATPQ